VVEEPPGERRPGLVDGVRGVEEVAVPEVLVLVLVLVLARWRKVPDDMSGDVRGGDERGPPESVSLRHAAIRPWPSRRIGL
jgi:hypothetical protein